VDRGNEAIIDCFNTGNGDEFTKTMVVGTARETQA
jgi:hypothetical protein